MDEAAITNIILWVLAIIVALIGYFFKRNEAQHQQNQDILKKQDDALATQSTALAVLVARVEPAIAVTQRVNNLEKQMAVLQDRVPRIDQPHT